MRRMTKTELSPESILSKLIDTCLKAGASDADASFGRSDGVSVEVRAGQLEGGREYVKWEMIDWILFKTPGNVVRYRKMIAQADLPTISCQSVRELRTLYDHWQLDAPN